MIGNGVLNAIARAFSSFGAFVALSIENARVNAGIMYGVCRRFDLAASQVVDVIFDPTAFTGDVVSLLPIGFDGIGGPIEIDVYRGVTANDDGTLVNPNNKKHSIVANGEVIMRVDPTGVVPGADLIGELLIPSDGSGAAGASSATTGELLACELDHTEKYLFRITNIDSSAAATLGIKIDFSEVP